MQSHTTEKTQMWSMALFLREDWGFLLLLIYTGANNYGKRIEIIFSEDLV